MKAQIEQLGSILADKTIKRGLLKESQNRISAELKGIEECRGNTEKAKEITNTVLLSIQREVKEVIEQIVSEGLKLVYGEEYSFSLGFTIKRGRSEAVPLVRKGEVELNMRDQLTGGGVCDLVSLLLRFAVWSLQENQTSPLFILDEPAKFVSRDKQPLLGELLSKLSKSLGIQILLVSHSPSIASSADKAYKIIQTGGVSFVEEM